VGLPEFNFCAAPLQEACDACLRTRKENTMAKTSFVDRIDHIVLTVTDIEATTRFYERALGMEREFFRGPEGQPRHALRFGNQKINLQDRATETPTQARAPTFGSGDFCLIAAVPLGRVQEHLETESIPLEAGPVPRRGALGALRSIYFRDPDGNLVEVAEYVQAAT
jgi:catechol 2,3-dioxygenase-like lactoylglutathione lyase family enzyme